MRKKQDELVGQIRELNQAKPRNKNDDGLVAEVTRIESELIVAKDELVRLMVEY
jgi:structural maintenance of chromosome 1